MEGSPYKAHKCPGRLLYGPVRVCCRTGSLGVRAGSPHVAQSVCLALSVAVLTTLCQPRPVQLINIATVHTRALPARGACCRGPPQGPRPLAGDHMELLVAAGYLNQTPCNSFLWSYGQCGGGCCECGGCGGGGGCRGCRDCSTCSSCCGY